ncbi:hypothetical protein V8G54_037140 [Vigna mungo]|uniref:Uncharacterized protein n=1 Tax=Vigna mungo TaxID=3915 RepID=A0AAQ3MIL0_VIGMU
MSVVPVFSRSVEILLDWTGHEDPIQFQTQYEIEKMGKQIVPVKSVIYALSPFQQKVMTGLWKDLPTKIHHKVSENWISATLLLGPLVGTYALGDLKRIINLSRTNNMLPGSPAKSPTGPREKFGIGVEIALRLDTLERGIKLLLVCSELPGKGEASSQVLSSCKS